MEVICLEDDAFFALVEKVVERLREKNNTKGNKWLSKEEAMKRLNITSHTTLQKFRDEGRIRFLSLQNLLHPKTSTIDRPTRYSFP